MSTDSEENPALSRRDNEGRVRLDRWQRSGQSARRKTCRGWTKAKVKERDMSPNTAEQEV